jgi:hypothetical protein
MDMHRIVVMINLQFDHTKGNFEELRKNESAHLQSWKEEGVLEHAFIKSEKDGAMLIFKDIGSIELKNRIEALPLFPHMQQVSYLNFEKGF